MENRDLTILKALFLPVVSWKKQLCELELLKDVKLKVYVIDRGFVWLDTSTIDCLADASTFVDDIKKRQGVKAAF